MFRLAVLTIAATLLLLSACGDPQEDAARTRTPELIHRQADTALNTSPTAILTREQALDLAARSNCLLCHKIEYKLVGPAWNDVAAKYKGDSKAAVTIASHIIAGGRFGWNFGTMPPRGGTAISDAEIASLARFIASLK